MPGPAITRTQNNNDTVSSQLHKFVQFSVDHSTTAPEAMPSLDDPAPPITVLNSKISFCRLINRATNSRTVDVQSVSQRNLFEDP
jgi:hypothetical protein